MRAVRTLAGILAVLAIACSTSRVSTVNGDDGPSVKPPDAAPPLASAAPPETAPNGPFYQPDPTGRPTEILRADALNTRYARLDRSACEAELDRRAIRVKRAPPTSGVATPVWLRGPLHGVSVHSPLSPKRREHNSAEIFDCRLVLALDDFAALVAAHDVVEIVHLSAFRPRSSRGCTAKYVGKQHCAALAVDIGKLKKKDGTVLDVERDFHGRIGLATCAGVAAPKPSTPAAEELWGFVCDAARRAIFHVILTPNYNVQHKNHFHLEITPDAAWMLIQ